MVARNTIVSGFTLAYIIPAVRRKKNKIYVGFSEFAFCLAQKL